MFTQIDEGLPFPRREEVDGAKSQEAQYLQSKL